MFNVWIGPGIAHFVSMVEGHKSDGAESACKANACVLCLCFLVIIIII